MLSLKINDQLQIRTLCEEDAEGLSACSVGYEPAAQINEWWFRDAHAFIREGLHKAIGATGFSASIWYQGQIVGIISLTIGGETHAGKADDSTGRIDYGLMPAHRGKGIMTKACSTLIDYAFRELMIDRIEITPDVVNTKSCAIPERLGFRMERVLERAVQYTPDLTGDLAVYAISKGEWHNTG